MDKIGKLAFLRKNIVRDSALIVLGSAIYAIGLSCFEAPYGLAAGGISGVAIILAKIASGYGINLPVGIQVLVMNALLMILVFRSGGIKYAARSIIGIVASSLLIDLFSFLPALGGGDILLCSLWGGLLVGLGLGLVFRAGGNTGGTDIIAQLLNKRTNISVGMMATAVDLAVIAASIPVFGMNIALYAGVAMYVGNLVIDMVIDGLTSRRAAYIISDEYQKIEHAILHDIDRGCTRLSAHGSYSGKERPVLMVVLGRSEEVMLKRVVAEIDSDALVIISKVSEAFGEGFGDIAS